MSADEHLGPQFHGTLRKIRGGQINPGHEQERTGDPHAYFTPHIQVAAEYGDVYQVQPLGPYEPDKIGETRESYKTRHPLRLVSSKPVAPYDPV